MSVKNTYRIDYMIKGYECDCFGLVKLPTLISVMMLASREQEKMLQVPSLVEWKNLTWIVVQNSIQINRLPYYEEKILIETEPIAYNKFFTYRRYTVYAQNGDCLVNMMTTFAMIDIAKRKLIPVDREVLDYYQVTNDQPNLRSEKLTLAVEPFARQKQYEVRVLDIDYNKHVNNTKYVEWMLDTVGMECLKGYRLKKLTIKYEREVRLNSIVTSYMSELASTEHELKTAHLIEENGVRCCQMNAEWEKFSSSIVIQTTENDRRITTAQ